MLRADLGGQPLVNPCLQVHDKVHSPEPPRGDRGNGPEIPAKDLLYDLKGVRMSLSNIADLKIEYHRILNMYFLCLPFFPAIEELCFQFQ